MLTRDRKAHGGAGIGPPRDYGSFESYLAGLERQGIKPGLARIARLLELCGNPQDSVSYIHVAGTNGKGSVCALVESVLRAAGYRTGLYTSPHLVSYRERIRVCGRKLEEGEVVALAAGVIRHAEAMSSEPCGRPSYFELTTALAIRCFSERGVDYAILEVGLGGRLDATNVVTAPFVGITGIDLEHQAQLGNDLFSIAVEKAAVIKEGARVVCGVVGEGAFRAIELRCREKSATLKKIGGDIIVDIMKQSPGGSEIVVGGAFDAPLKLHLPLAGRYQAENCAVACGLLGEMRAGGVKLSESAILDGIASVRWPGRMDILCRDPLLIADCAHNPAGARSAAAAVAELYPSRRWVIVLGALRDKNIREICGALLPLASAVVVTGVSSERSAPPRELAAACREQTHAGVREAPGVREALAIARDLVRRERAGGVLVTGSIYLVGEVMKEMGIEPG